ncbi:MAG: peptide chain release factor N(5)-glutamine methyltransferase [Rhodobiaceae bacterium]|nr:peptide chain release factor N(5)-glutamine methyltransferase [Rhodobiaceae bacterium]
MSASQGGSADAGTSVGAAVRQLTRQFTAAGIDSAPLDARLLVQHAAGLAHEDLLRDPAALLSPATMQTLAGLAARRAAREPVARILGHAPFLDLDLVLSAETLMPRPETELLVETCVGLLSGEPAPLIADAGTGSGCILLGLLATLPHARGIGIDCSEGALDVARGNARRLGLAQRCDFVAGDWLAGHEKIFDLVVSNPPYIRSGDIAALAAEVRDHDPRAALDGGADGLDAYRMLVPQAAGVLREGGFLALETGTGQTAAVMELMRTAGFGSLHVAHDLAGHDRIVSGQRTG